MTNEQIEGLKQECIALRRCTGTDAGIISDTIDFLASQNRILADGCVSVPIETMKILQDTLKDNLARFEHIQSVADDLIAAQTEKREGE